MEYLYWIGGITIYFAGAGWAWGHYKSSHPKQELWDDPSHLFLGMFWPIYLISSVSSKLSFEFHSKQLQKKKIRIAEQKRIQAEIDSFEKEVEQEINDSLNSHAR